MTEDAVQDVLLAIHEKRHTYDPARPFGPWLALGGIVALLWGREAVTAWLGRFPG